MPKRVLNEDLVRVYGKRFDRWTGKLKKGILKMLYWGDEVHLVNLAENDDPNLKEVRVRVHNYLSLVKTPSAWKWVATEVRSPGPSSRKSA